MDGPGMKPAAMMGFLNSPGFLCRGKEKRGFPGCVSIPVFGEKGHFHGCACYKGGVPFDEVPC